ncbi:hypothetical protein [Secundilactobacillus paracollinoides]|uniref:hypothetical protein n=1 Tax=Secundilactobacillus paracollinoides TaxID=240427 RepID=UPI000A69838A|nr:hypothetical protein [Secundilactobacillus paracollinoides]
MSESLKAAACAWQPAANKKNVYNKRFSTGELPVEPNCYTLVWGLLSLGDSRLNAD